MDNPQLEIYTPLVARVLRIEDITSGGAKDPYYARYRGQLYGESTQAYDQLAAGMKPLGITPLFRTEEDRHVVLLMQGTINPTPSNPWINILLFAATVLSVLYAGALYSYQGPVTENLLDTLLAPLTHLAEGIPFAVSLLAILLAHEFGHYLAARYHKVHVTLPYFIPLPISPLGTMGAAIRLKEPPTNKRVLLDIGIAGPLAGLVVAIPVLLYGLSISTVGHINPLPGQGLQLEGNSLVYLLAKYMVFGQVLPAPLAYDGLSPLLYWVRYFFTSQPLPIGGLDVMISPVAWAGWAGLLVTALNLIPAGQLDGGHLIFVLLGKRARMFWPIILGILVVLGFVWSGWWFWALIILILGRIYAEPLDQITTLDPNRKALAVFGLFVFILVFTPVPLVQFMT